MLAIKCKQSHGDHTLFIKHSTSRGVIALLVYVDDITVTSNDPREKEALWHCLARECEIKELGKLKYFLGIKVAHSKEDTHIEPNHKLGEVLEDQGWIVDHVMYQRFVGELIT
ncbi:hypothetical protein CK203_116119 [Vitis vinifera]|uniref:Reverse transcriptase Ty1/copia-type domain-containing protein n=1 Tax=Vitis vinifera TaxID=29760 RepID=A0A438FDX1_VITVI|nr:hypothetical protein CK203_116119 [Vitis vinifera]